MPRAEWRWYLAEPLFDGPHDTEDDARSFGLRNNIPEPYKIVRLPTTSEERAKRMYRHNDLEETHDLAHATRRFKSIRSFRNFSPIVLREEL